MENNRENFTRIGFILASAGSAIGLGNIRRFPYMVGENGGGAFLLVYFFMIILIGITLLLVEFTIGRAHNRNAVDSYGAISPKMKWVGWLGFFSAPIFLSYYSVIGGWTLNYTVSSLTGSLSKVLPAEMGNYFGEFIASPIMPLVYHLIFMAVTMAVIIAGIRSGIEKFSKIMMPVLLVLMLILVVRGITLPGAMEGIKWYLQPDFSKIGLNTFLAALGQVFFSLSVGMSGMLTYASYLKKDERLPQTSLVVAGLDALIALIAGFMIFPVLFSFGVEPGQGVGLVFITMPMVFSQLPLGNIFGAIFFALLFVAALTSSVSILEMPVTIMIEKYNITRKKASIIIASIAYVLGIAVSLGFGLWGDVRILGQDIFGLFDYFGSNISLPLGALGGAIAVGWFWKKKRAVEEVTNFGEAPFALSSVWFNIVKWLAPIAIILIFLLNIGLI